jgi:hypothetical protein
MPPSSSPAARHDQHLDIPGPRGHLKVGCADIREDMCCPIRSTAVRVVRDRPAGGRDASTFREERIIERAPPCQRRTSQQAGSYHCREALHSFTPFVLGASIQVAPMNAPLVVKVNVTLLAGTLVVFGG